MFLVRIGHLALAGDRLAPNAAAVAMALLLGTIEIIQIHLPGRVAEITDPLLALILAMILRHSERLQNSRSSSCAL